MADSQVGPRITWAALDLGRVQARIKAADARAEASLAFYERTVLAALEETEDALVDFGHEQTRQQFLQASAQASQQAANLAHQRYEGGAADFLSVLDAERTLLEAQDRLAASQTGTATAFVAEYVSLVRSRHDGVCFDRVEPAFQRYVANPVQSRHEIWSLRHPLRRASRGKILRIILAAEATIVWSTDDWARTNRSDTTHESGLKLCFADFPTAEWPAGSVFTFTCFWKRDHRWEGRNWQVSVL